MRRRWALLLGFAALWPISPVAGQVPSARECEITNGKDLLVLNQGSSMERVILRGEAEIQCRDGVVVRADSMVSHTATGRREFIGHVFFQDSLKSLTADRVEYEHADGRLLALGNVVLTDQLDGSVVRDGSELEYLRATDLRPEPWAVIRGRPHATLYDSRQPADTVGDAGAQAEPEPPLEVDADVIEIIGERLFRGIGNVELQRGDTHGTAAEAEFDEIDQRVVLIGDAMIEGESFTLTGERLVALLDGERLREVRVLEDAILLSEDLRIDAPELQVYFRDGAVQRMIAMRLPGEASPDTSAALAGATDDAADDAGDDTGDGAGDGAPEVGVRAPVRTVGPQPRATATEFWLVADSIDALIPDQRLETVVAVGNAYGERVADSLTALLPELVGRDWLRGDTITGYFIEAPVPDTAAAEPGSEGGAKERVVLERLVTVGEGGKAQSLYRIREEGKAQPGVNFLIANRITLFLHDGEVTSVEAEGPIRGYHLQPKGDGGGEPGDDVVSPAESRHGPPPER